MNMPSRGVIKVSLGDSIQLLGSLLQLSALKRHGAVSKDKSDGSSRIGLEVRLFDALPKAFRCGVCAVYL